MSTDLTSVLTFTFQRLADPGLGTTETLLLSIPKMVWNPSVISGDTDNVYSLQAGCDCSFRTEMVCSIGMARLFESLRSPNKVPAYSRNHSSNSRLPGKTEMVPSTYHERGGPLVAKYP